VFQKIKASRGVIILDACAGSLCAHGKYVLFTDCSLIRTHMFLGSLLKNKPERLSGNNGIIGVRPWIRKHFVNTGRRTHRPYPRPSFFGTGRSTLLTESSGIGKKRKQ
jgi:hypothetical protein